MDYFTPVERSFVFPWGPKKGQSLTDLIKDDPDYLKRQHLQGIVLLKPDVILELEMKGVDFNDLYAKTPI